MLSAAAMCDFEPKNSETKYSARTHGSRRISRNSVDRARHEFQVWKTELAPLVSIFEFGAYFLYIMIFSKGLESNFLTRRL